MIWLKGFRICTVKESHFHLVIPQCTIILNKMSTAPVLYETKLLKKIWCFQWDFIWRKTVCKFSQIFVHIYANFYKWHLIYFGSILEKYSQRSVNLLWIIIVIIWINPENAPVTLLFSCCSIKYTFHNHKIVPQSSVKVHLFI